MAYTIHGHHVPGTLRGEGVVKAPAPSRCGGVKDCDVCKNEAKKIAEYMIGAPVNLQLWAMNIIKTYIDNGYGGVDLPAYETYVVWFSKTLQNWKALVGTTMADGRYYEVTYDGDKKQTYLDVYSRLTNIVIKD